MPELPEVETIKSQLASLLPMKLEKISFSSNSKNLIKQKDFIPKPNEIITELVRKGKFLIFKFDNPDHYIISHLGMSGSWRRSDTRLNPIEGKHAHIIFETDKQVLSYIDPRRFGQIHFLNKKNFEAKMQSYPIDISESGFDADWIKAIFDRYPNKTLKPFLLDQKYFFGVGNYIASEICARAKLLPSRKVSTLTKRDAGKIKKAIDLILSNAIKTAGTTFGGGYRDAFGEKGEGVQHLVVFHQETCQMCKKTKVIKTLLGGRGTYHCPTCQK